MENKKTFVSNLQGIRGYAILLIFLSHCNFGLNEVGINRSTWLGAFGVSLFIMLSGYLLLENHVEEKIDFWAYIKKKVYKFYPLHIVTMIVALPFSIKALINFDRTQIIGLFANVTLLQTWIPNPNIYFSYNAVSWYLSLALFCVIMSPIVLRIFNYKNSNHGMANSLSMLLFYIVMDCFLYLIFGKSSVAHWILYILPVVRMIEYMYGGGIWKLRKSCNLDRNEENIIGVIGIVLCAIIYVVSMNSNDELYSALAWIVPSALLIFFATSNTELSKVIFANKLVLFLGQVSFELFLWHQVCIRYVTAVFNRLDINCMPINIFINAIVSIVVTLIWRKIWRRLSSIR